MILDNLVQITGIHQIVYTKNIQLFTQNVTYFDEFGFQHNGSRQMKTYNVRWKQVSYSSSGAYTF